MVPTVEIHGEWFRCVSLRRDPLSAEGSRLRGGRLNHRGEPALYLAGTPTLAVAENLRLGSMFGVDHFPPRLLVTIEVSLSRVVDLTLQTTRAACGIAETNLTDAWQPTAPATHLQRLAAKLIESGIEGILYPSAIEPSAANLAVFMRSVASSGSLRVVGED